MKNGILLCGCEIGKNSNWCHKKRKSFTSLLEPHNVAFVDYATLPQQAPSPIEVVFPLMGVVLVSYLGSSLHLACCKPITYLYKDSNMIS